jgi:hypothetical protein
MAIYACTLTCANPYVNPHHLCLLDAMCNNGDADGWLQQYLNEGSRCNESQKRRRRSHSQKWAPEPAREPVQESK